MARFSIEIPQRSPSFYRQYYPMGQEGSSLASPRQESVPRTNGPLRRSLSPFFGSRTPIKRERSRSTSPNTPRRRRAFESWDAYKDDIAKNYKPPALPAPPAPKYKACARCQSKGMVCDGRDRCQRCIWKNATCIYDEKGTEPCLRCRDRRYKCDKEIPCNRCVAGCAKCEYEQEPPRFEVVFAPIIKAEEKNPDDVQSAEVSPPDSTIPPGPRKLKRPASGWMDRYREKTEPTQSTIRTQQRYPRPPKPLRAKKPIHNVRGQRGIQRAPQWSAERDTYDDFVAQIRTPTTKVRIMDSSSWTMLDRDELLELGNSNATFDLDFGQFQHSNTRQSPDSQQWAAFPSPISLGGHLQENTPSQVSAGRSSEIAQSTREQKRPSLLKPLQRISYIALGPNDFAVYSDFLDFYCPVLANTLLNAGDKAAIPEVLADVDIDVFGLFIQWLYTQSLLNKNSQPAYQHRSMALWVLAKRLEMPALQNDSLDVLEERRRIEGTIQTKTFAYVYANTVKGDPLRGYLVDVCSRLMGTFMSEEVEQLFPEDMREEIGEALAVKPKDAGGREKSFEIETTQYHVPVDNI